LLNEAALLSAAARLYLGGIGDAHFYGMDNIEKAPAAIPQDKFSILISHTPEVYRQAADANFNVLPSGHTHGGHAQFGLAAVNGLGRFELGRRIKQRSVIVLWAVDPSALLPIADIRQCRWDVRLVPIADMAQRLLKARSPS
jgi:hypothetical protein